MLALPGRERLRKPIIDVVSGDGASGDDAGDGHADDGSVSGESLMPSQGGMSVLDGDSLGGSDVSEEELAGLGAGG